MQIRTSFTLVALAVVSASVQAQLYGVSSVNGQDDFCIINTTTGAATTLFSFTVAGTTGVEALTYIPSTNKFITTGNVDAFHSKLVEIDPVLQTATVVATGIPTSYFEGVEYVSALNGLAVSYGPGGFFSGELALLNPTTYGLIGNNSSTSLPDGDTLFLDGNNDLNVMDSNNPAFGFMRNRVLNPFGSSSLSPLGSNMFGAGDDDFAWKADEGKLFLTQETHLSVVNAASTLITTVGAFGGNSTGALYRMTGITALATPEPTSLVGLGFGAGLLLLRRRRSVRKG